MSQILRNVKESVRDFGTRLKDLIRNIKIRLGVQKKPTEIPESWVKPKWDSPLSWLFDKDSIPVKKNPLARIPRFSFNIPKRDLAFFRSNIAFRAKRTMIFFLLVACLISIISFSLVNPLSLLFYIPTTYIYLDYLRRTRTKKRKVWLVLKDIEDDS